MVKEARSTVVALMVAFALVVSATAAGPLQAAEPEKQAKKPKAAPETRAPKPKDKPKFQSAETAAKGKACFGVAPKIEKLVPDEGKAGDKITIKGSQFGAPDCLRGVSFGPGHDAKFMMQNETTITATVPGGGRKGLAMVTVTTASGEDSKAFLLK